MLAYFISMGQAHFLIVLPQRIFSGIDQFVLLAIPLFIFAGNVMTAGHLTSRLLDVANIVVGRFRGGSSLSAVWGSFLFGGVSGSAAADAAALSSVLLPEMKRQGYNVDYSAALIGVSSLMAPLIPPSIAMIIYGALSGTSIGRLFIAGIVPGFLLAVALSLYAVWIAHRRGYPRHDVISRNQILPIISAAGPVLLLPVIIIVGIRGGAFTPTEAAAVAAVYAVAVAGLWQRTLSWAGLSQALLQTALMSSAIYLLIGMAYIAAFIFSIEGVPGMVLRSLQAISDNPIVLLLLINLGLLLLGMVLDIVAILILTVPALTVVGNAIGLDPVHLGVIIVFNTLIGFMTPPVGFCLFIVSAVAKRPVERVALQALPLLAVAIVVLLIVTFVPAVVLVLPNLIMG
jgi:tripartite ATP-independent transporter DctM subunit